MAGHVAPEAARGGPIAAVREGDIITFDIDTRELRLEMRRATRDRARGSAIWTPPKPRYDDRRAGQVRQARSRLERATRPAVTG